MYTISTSVLIVLKGYLTSVWGEEGTVASTKKEKPNNDLP